MEALSTDSDRGGTDTPLDGELGLGDDNTVISRFFRGGQTELALNDNDSPASFNLGAYFTSGGDGEDLTLYFQTAADGEISFAASQFASGGGNFVRFTLPADAQDLLDNLATDDRFIFKAARPSSIAPSDGNAGMLEWSVSFGSATGSTVAPDAPEFDGNAGALEWSAEFGTATGTTVPPDAPEFFGNASTLEWSVSFGTATGTTTTPDVTGFLWQRRRD